MKSFRLLGQSAFLFVFVAFLSTLLTLASPHAVHAQFSSWFSDPPAEGLDAAAQTGEVNHEGYSHKTNVNVIGSLITLIQPACGISTKNAAMLPVLQRQSAMGTMTQSIAFMYGNQPADMGLWIADVGSSLGFMPKQAYAQGIGFSGLSALLPIWKAFRNIAYLLLAIVMVAIGFMVMFRKKIDPKTVVTVQNSIPRIVVTVILITFSYAIVALTIDVMYLVMFLAAAMMKTTGLFPPLPAGWGIKPGLLQFFELWGIPDMIMNILNYSSPEQVFTTGGLRAVFDALFPYGDASKTNLVMDIMGPGLMGISALIGGLAGTVVSVGPGTVVGAIAGAAGPPILGTLIISLALLFTFIRLFFLFLNAYIQIILALLLGPIQILFEAFPGGVGFMSWFKNLFANIAVFPIASVMFMITYMLVNMAGTAGFYRGCTQYSANPLTGSIWSPPFLVGINEAQAGSIAALFALGFLMVIPNVANSIKEQLKAKPLVPAGPGAILSPVTGAYQTGMGALSQFYYGAQIFSMVKGLTGGDGGDKPKKTK